MNDTIGDYVNAITAERAAHQREYLRGVHGTYKEESIKAAHARTCGRIIAQAYRAGDYPDMWLLLDRMTGNANKSKTTAGLNAATIGEQYQIRLHNLYS